LPPDVIVEPLPPGETLSGMLERGDLDAVMGATVPSPVRRGSPHVRLLFPDYEAQEAAYYRRTGIFPIMHVFALRSDVYRAHPWAARSLYVALRTARDRALQNLTRSAGAPRTLLPWAAAAAAEQGAALQTPDPWTYGVAANRPTLEAAVQYSYEQGLSARRLAVEELFAPETLED
jgi:4,5-dihydroxyphthalate decarboxylase